MASRPPRIRAFRPLVSGATRVLILGSMPGVTALKARQYYAHPQNAFWPIMGALCGAGRELPYEERLRVLAKSGIGVWNVFRSCRREGSLDADIRDVEMQDFSGLFRRHDIRHIFFNGKVPEKAFCTRILPTLPALDIPMTALPCTSPAMAKLSFGQKLQAWKVVGKALAD